METNKILLTSEEVSKKFFNGKRSPWSLLQDVKKKRLPALHIGKRVFFELHTLNSWFDSQLAESLNNTMEVSKYDGGIRKID